MIEHSADLLDKFVVGKDGRTAYERVKGKKYSGLMFPFGTKVLHRVPAKVQGGAMDPRWLPAVWLRRRQAKQMRENCKRQSSRLINQKCGRTVMRVNQEILVTLKGKYRSPQT